MEASPFHHPYPLEQSLLNPSPTTTAANPTTSIGFSDELPQPHDQIIPNGSIEVSGRSNQVSICNNLQSSDCSLPMVVPGHNYKRTSPTTNFYGMTNKTSRKRRNQNKRNIDQENEKKTRDSKEGQIGYVYVRARRGEATDSHSLAERVRREKISEKMKALQAIVPGCDKITGKALMLEEVINYVQSLQNEIQFLSSKLSCLNPMYTSELDFDSSMLHAHQSMTTNQQQFLSFQERQMSIMGFENNEEILWDMEEQRQGLADPFAIINSFDSYY
ncbi:hypothetical protein L2E82_46353 [Cichorium intybus]|uniref:Uncharacterized protein n=1 Tax=Cichorium intybus TaxID=13427 RepID=A0ACB8YTM9_CICIN|nr:hypothetical protein L2E82_46353 [Cichorium intybus]